MNNKRERGDREGGERRGERRRDTKRRDKGNRDNNFFYQLPTYELLLFYSKVDMFIYH